MIVEPIRTPSPGKEGLAMSAQNKSSRIDEWMLQKIYRAAGQPSVRLGLRNSAEVSPKDALACLQRLRDSTGKARPAFVERKGRIYVDLEKMENEAAV